MFFHCAHEAFMLPVSWSTESPWMCTVYLPNAAIFQRSLIVHFTFVNYRSQVAYKQRLKVTGSSPLNTFTQTTQTQTKNRK